MRVSIQRYFQLAIVLAVFAFFSQIATAADPVHTSSSQVFEGTLNIVWGDPHPETDSSGGVDYTLTLLNGMNVPLQMAGQDNVAAYYFGKQVEVSGRIVVNQSAATRDQKPETILVDTIRPVQMQQEHGPTSRVFGTRKVIYLLLKFQDDISVPHPPQFYIDLNNPDVPPAGATFSATINGFFKKSSWNQFSWEGDVGGMGGIGAPGGWLTLPHPRSYYVPCASGMCADRDALFEDGVTLGMEQGINFSNYDNINLVFSNDLDCCAWGGSACILGKCYGVTWEPPWGQDTNTYSHEMGHSIGLTHSGWVYYTYDNPWDMMSGKPPACDQCGSSYCCGPGTGFIAAYKDYLGWIPAENQLVLSDTFSSVTTILEANALPLSSDIKMIKICLPGFPCTGWNARYFTVEARVKGLGTISQYDNGIPGEGVIIHMFQGDRPSVNGKCFWNNSSGWAWPIDSTSGDFDSVNCSVIGFEYPNYALLNAQWLPGQIYTDNNYGFSIQVVDRIDSVFVVTVNNNRAAQSISTISFSPTTITKGGTTTASATASSGLPVSFSSTTPHVCTVSGSTVKGISPGTCTVAANQAGNGTFNPAPQVTGSILITDSPTITTSTTKSSTSILPTTTVKTTSSTTTAKTTISTTSTSSAITTSIISTTTTTTIPPKLARVTAYIGPPKAVQQGARWRLDQRKWMKNGVWLKGILPGQHKISFKPIPGWITPSSFRIKVTQGDYHFARIYQRKK